MLELEEVIPNLEVLFKEYNLIKNNLGPTILFEKIDPILLKLRDFISLLN